MHCERSGNHAPFRCVPLSPCSAQCRRLVSTLSACSWTVASLIPQGNLTSCRRRGRCAEPRCRRACKRRWLTGRRSFEVGIPPFASARPGSSEPTLSCLLLPPHGARVTAQTAQRSAQRFVSVSCSSGWGRPSACASSSRTAEPKHYRPQSPVSGQWNQVCVESAAAATCCRTQRSTTGRGRWALLRDDLLTQVHRNGSQRSSRRELRNRGSTV